MELGIYLGVTVLFLIWLLWKKKHKVKYVPNRRIRRAYEKAGVITKEESIGMGRYNKYHITHRDPEKQHEKLMHKFKKAMKRYEMKLDKARKRAEQGQGV